MSPKEMNYENLAETIIAKLATRNMEGYYCKDREEANAKAKRFLTPDCSVSWENKILTNMWRDTGSICAGNV